MAMEGMDVQEVQQLVGQMHTLESQLQGVINGMQHVVSAMQPAWRGADADKFQHDWPQHHTQLSTALTGLQDMITHTNSNLQDQIHASTNY